MAVGGGIRVGRRGDRGGDGKRPAVMSGGARGGSLLSLLSGAGRCCRGWECAKCVTAGGGGGTGGAGCVARLFGRGNFFQLHLVSVSFHGPVRLLVREVSASEAAETGG